MACEHFSYFSTCALLPGTGLDVQITSTSFEDFFGPSIVPYLSYIEPSITSLAAELCAQDSNHSLTECARAGGGYLRYMCVPRQTGFVFSTIFYSSLCVCFKFIFIS